MFLSLHNHVIVDTVTDLLTKFGGLVCDMVLQWLSKNSDVPQPSTYCPQKEKGHSSYQVSRMKVKYILIYSAETVFKVFVTFTFDLQT